MVYAVFMVILWDKAVNCFKELTKHNGGVNLLLQGNKSENAKFLSINRQYFLSPITALCVEF